MKEERSFFSVLGALYKIPEKLLEFVKLCSLLSPRNTMDLFESKWDSVNRASLRKTVFESSHDLVHYYETCMLNPR